MAARKQPNTAKAVAWTTTGRSEVEGPIAEVVYYTFMAVPRSQRDSLLRRLQEWSNQAPGGQQS